MASKAEILNDRVERYFKACNYGLEDEFVRLFKPNAVHYLPKGMFGPICDAESLFTQWRRDSEENGSYWILETCFSDAEKMVSVAEWTAVKPAQKIYFRGVDVFIFNSDFFITEVRVYYATARDPKVGPNELGGFEYSAAGWWVPRESGAYPQHGEA